MARKKRFELLDPPIEAALAIEDMSAMGEGRARHGEDVVFVPQSIPGEQVVASIWRKNRHSLEADLTQVQAPSPHRVTPPCPYFGPCTGCQWQHIAYPYQLELKTRMVEDQVRRVAGFERAPVRPTIGCEVPWHYRNHARFTIGPGGQLGFVNRARRRFVRIDRCLIMDEGVNSVLAQLQGKCGETTQLSVRYGARTGKYLIQPTLQSLDVALDTGQTHYEEELLGRRFRIASPSFFQVNTRQAERLVDIVRQRLALQAGETLVDAYAGVGTFAVLLSPLVRRVYAIEESSSAIKDAQVNAAGLDNVVFLETRTEQALATLGERPDALILDPPRAGCHPDAVTALAQLAPGRVVYVSCDPATLARDLKAICQGPFVLEEVQPIDLFPHTYHIEAVATLRKR